MNERIKQLARQSGALPTQDCGVPQWYIDEDEFEKFAELIVRECAKFLDENSGYDECNNSWHPQPEDLLQHFGVEE
jgi:hypothetical protein